MPFFVTMPALSPTMEKGNIAKWTVGEGTSVAVGDVILEVETDKAVMEVESSDAGVIAKILKNNGSADIKVGEPIAVMLKKNESASDLSSFLSANTHLLSSSSSSSSSSSDKKNAVSNVDKASSSAVASSSVSEVKNKSDSESKIEAQVNTNAISSVNSDVDVRLVKGVASSPLARNIAAARGVDISNVYGTGPRGRVLKRDVEVYSSSSAGGKEVYGFGRVSSKAAPESIDVSQMKKIIGQRTLSSKNNVPHFYLKADINASNLIKMREDINYYILSLDKSPDAIKSKISVNDIVVKAVGVSLASHPEMNRYFQDGKIFQLHTVDVCVAVSVNGGLVAPKICDVDLKKLTNLSVESKDIINRARSGKISLDEMQGGSITISNLGMFDVDEFLPIINQPHSAIIGVGSISSKPIVNDDNQIVVGDVMTVTISADHRVVDGADVAKFLKTLKDLLENPSPLLI